MKSKKIESTKLQNELKELYNKASKRLISDIRSELDNIIKEGLSLKGYSVDSQTELFRLLKERGERVLFHETETFYIDKTPFLEIKKMPYFAKHGIHEVAICHSLKHAAYKFL